MSATNNTNFNNEIILKNELLSLFNELKTQLTTIGEKAAQTESITSTYNEYKEVFSAFFEKPLIQANFTSPLALDLFKTVFPKSNSDQNAIYILLKAQTNFRPTINQQDLQNILLNYVSLRHGNIALKFDKILSELKSDESKVSLKDLSKVMYPAIESSMIRDKGKNITVHYASEKEFFKIMDTIGTFVKNNVKDLTMPIFSVCDNILIFECSDELNTKYKKDIAVIKHILSNFKRY